MLLLLLLLLEQLQGELVVALDLGGAGLGEQRLAKPGDRLLGLALAEGGGAGVVGRAGDAGRLGSVQPRDRTLEVSGRRQGGAEVEGELVVVGVEGGGSGERGGRLCGVALPPVGHGPTRQPAIAARQPALPPRYVDRRGGTLRVAGDHGGRWWHTGCDRRLGVRRRSGRQGQDGERHHRQPPPGGQREPDDQQRGRRPEQHREPFHLTLPLLDLELAGAQALDVCHEIALAHVLETQHLAADRVRHLLEHLRLGPSHHRTPLPIPLVADRAVLVEHRDRSTALGSGEHCEHADPGPSESLGGAGGVTLQVLAVGQQHDDATVPLPGKELEGRGGSPLDVRPGQRHHAGLDRVEEHRDRVEVRGQRDQRVGLAGEHHHPEAVAGQRRQRSPQQQQTGLEPGRREVRATHRVRHVQRDHQVAGLEGHLVRRRSPLRPRQGQHQARRRAAPQQQPNQAGCRRTPHQPRPHRRRGQGALLAEAAPMAPARQHRGQGGQQQQQQSPRLAEGHHGVLPASPSRATATSSRASADAAQGSKRSR